MTMMMMVINDERIYRSLATAAQAGITPKSSLRVTATLMQDCASSRSAVGMVLG